MYKTKSYSIKAPDGLQGIVRLPASKSISNRALIIKSLASYYGGSSEGLLLPDNISDCDDTRVIVDALSRRPAVIDIGAAGTAMRFLTAYLSVTDGVHTLTGSERMRQRPIGLLVDALRALGADIRYAGREGFPPLLIHGGRGKLTGAHIQIPGNVSSQYISALLMIGPILRNGLELELTDDITSRPYIDLTLSVMHRFGASAEWTDISVISVNGDGYRDAPFTVESDWSAASYWYEMMALSPGADDDVTLTGLMDGSRQGDSTARYLFSLMGVKTTFGITAIEIPTTVRLKKRRRRLPRLDFDFANIPDIAQTMVVTCCLKGIPFHFEGLHTLRIKETDRIEALKHEMRKLGFVLRDIEGTGLIWDGERCEPTGYVVDTYHDHRMALAFAPAAFLYPGIEIMDPAVVTKSYPRFWDDMRSMGFTIEEKG